MLLITITYWGFVMKVSRRCTAGRLQSIPKTTKKSGVHRKELYLMVWDTRRRRYAWVPRTGTLHDVVDMIGDRPVVHFKAVRRPYPGFWSRSRM